MSSTSSASSSISTTAASSTTSSVSSSFSNNATFTTPPATETSQNAGDSNNNSNDNNNNPLSVNGTLYLYTFLATLVLLLAVSSAIVLRSLIIRRRHARMVEEAIANGTWVPPTPTTGRGKKRKDFGNKPELYEAWVDAGTVEKLADATNRHLREKEMLAGGAGARESTYTTASATDEEEGGVPEWEWEKPLTAAWLKLPSDTATNPDYDAARALPHRSFRDRLLFRRPRPPPTPATPTAPNTPTVIPGSAPSEPPPPMPIQVAVLIAMPVQGGIAPPPQTPAGDTTLIAGGGGVVTEEEEREAPLVEVGIWNGEVSHRAGTS